MKLRIVTKLFLAMTISMCVPLGLMLASVHWSFREGFADYLHQVELDRLDKLNGLLTEAYRRHHGWKFIETDPHSWPRLLAEGLDERPANAEAGPNRLPSEPTPTHAPEDFDPFPPHGPPPDLAEWPPELGAMPPDLPPPPPRHPPPPPRDPLMLGRRVQLLDAEQRVVTHPPPGEPSVESDRRPASLLPIRVDGTTVGWLRVSRPEIVSDRLALAFIARQSRSNLLILGLTILVAALASLGLARGIVRPLRRIAAGTKTLAAGHYEVTLPVGSDELGELARDFNLLALTLQRNEQARRQWVADISHELRTPVAVLRGEIEALLDGVRQPSVERIGSLHGEVLSLGKLVDDLYDLSLSDLGALNYRREPVDLVEIVGAAVDSVRGRFDDKGIDLVTHTDPSAMILGDRQRLLQLLGNLLENTHRYTDSGGRCEIRVQAGIDTVSLMIDDTPPGVPHEALARLFDRLFRIDSSRSREHGGAGLGLAICRNIVEAHGGTIIAEASPLGGLRLQIAIPRHTP